MFPDPDLENDEDDFVDYPSTDDDDDDDTYSDATDADDEAFDDLADRELELDTDQWATLSTEVRYDLANPPADDVFYIAVDTEPIVTIYRGHEFFDSIEPIADPTFVCSTLPWYHWIKLLLFWTSTVFWDTTVHFVSSPPPLLRRVRRRRNPITNPAYPKTWMLFTGCLMVGLDAFSGHIPPFPFITPITMAHASITRGYETYGRIERLDELVDLNPGTFLQYQTWQYRIVNDMLEARKPTSASS